MPRPTAKSARFDIFNLYFFGGGLEKSLGKFNVCNIVLDML